MKEEILIQLTVSEAVMLRDLIWRNRRSFRKLKGLMAKLEDGIIEKVESPSNPHAV